MHQVLDNGGSLNSFEGIGDEAVVLEKLIEERKQGHIIGKEIVVNYENNKYYFLFNGKKFYFEIDSNNELYYSFDGFKIYSNKVVIQNEIYKKPEGVSYLKVLCNEMYYKEYFPDKYKIADKTYRKPFLKNEDLFLKTLWNLDMPIIY